MKSPFFILVASALLVAGGIPVAAQQLPPIRQVGSVVTSTSEKLNAVSAVRQLSDGRVLVNDVVGRRVLLFDSSLKTFTVVADTTSATSSAYGTRPGGLIPFRGDTTLFVDPASLSMLVIDGNGRIARVMSVPRPSDAMFLIGGTFGSAGLDPQGRLIYRAPPRMMMRGGPGGPGAGGGGRGLGDFTPPDSAPIVRVDLATRKLDTLSFFRTQKMQMNVTRTPDGGINVSPTINPLSVIDDWAVLPDGTVALVRGRDYHVDWITPEKTVTSSPKIPFEWERLTDEAKVAFIDSTRKAMNEARASGNPAGMLGGAFGGAPMVRTGGGDAAGRGTPAATPATPAATPATPATPAAPSAPVGHAPAAHDDGAVTTTTTMSGGGNMTVVTSGPGGIGSGRLPPVSLVAPTELPDYKPPFSVGSTRVDADGNLWIRTTQNVNGVPVYNVVNRKGELVDRVQLPKGRVIAGFGTAGSIYLAHRDGDTVRLERVNIR